MNVTVVSDAPIVATVVEDTIGLVLSSGTDGTDGKTVLNGAGAPSGGLGTNGDFYIDTTSSTIYGPKAGGAWGSPVSLVGPAGEAGAERREFLTAPRTYYVATTGSDTLNDGLTVGSPFLTIQKAVDIVSATLDHGAQVLTIQVSDGTYTAGAVLNQHIGSGLITILGNPTTPANCVISVTSGRCFQCAWSSWSVSGFRLTTSGGAGSAIYSTGNTARLRVISIDFGSAVVSHIEVQNSALLDLVSCNISGGAQYHQYVGAGGRFATSVQTTTLTGAPAFSVAFHRNSSGSIANVANVTYSGSATGVRYIVDLTAVTICGGSVTFFPGNVSGTVASGGQYS